MLNFKEKIYFENLPNLSKAILVADIGGTNSNFGILIKNDNKLELLFSIHFKSNEITNFPAIIKQVLDYLAKNYNFHPKSMCIGAAGFPLPDRDFIEPTNLNFVIDASEIKQKTGLEKVLIINDFEAVAYGIDVIDDNSFKKVRNGSFNTIFTRAVIGAGTGLGKAILHYDKHANCYDVLPSEGGHADFAIHSERDFKLVEFIKNKEELDVVSWENVLSGKGVIQIFKFLGTQDNYQESKIVKKIIENGYHPDQIFANWDKDQRCYDTFYMYAGFYGRCAKNFCLETLALGGIYIAGGIAANNLPLFELDVFHQEFVMSDKMGKNLLEKVSISIISDYNISLFGAANYLLRFN